MSRAYDGDLETKFIKLGGQRVLLAPYGTGIVAPAAKISDVSNPPTGWRDCGSINNHNVEVASKKELFFIRDGVPESIKYQEIVGMEATVKAVLNEWRFKNIWETLGQPPVKHTLGVGTDTVQNGSTRSVIKVVDGSQFAVNDVIVIAPTADKLTSANVHTISSISTNDLTIVPILDELPTNGDEVNEVSGTLMGFGDTEVVYLQAIVLFDAKDGTQILHHIPKCAMLGEYNPALSKGKENIVLPMEFQAYGVVDPDLNKTVLVRILKFYKNT